MESKLMPCDAEEEFDHDYTSEMVCPYCGYVHTDSWEWEGKDLEASGEYECDHCGKEFSVTRTFSVFYSTERKEVSADDHK